MKDTGVWQSANGSLHVKHPTNVVRVSGDIFPRTAVPLVRKDEADWIIDRLSADCDRYMAERDDYREALFRSQRVVAEVAKACGLDGGELDRSVADAARRLAREIDDLRAQHDADAALIAELRAKVARTQERAEKAEANNRTKRRKMRRLRRRMRDVGMTTTGDFDDEGLPTPDATNPVHLRFAADVIEQTAAPKNLGGDGENQDRSARELRAEADRLERERFESAEREQRIEQIEQVIGEAVDHVQHVLNVDELERVIKSVRTDLDAAGMLTGGDA